MKHDESRELTSARKLLSDFEREMALPGAKTKLSEALSVISGAMEGVGAERKIARNIIQVYAAKAAASATATLNEPGEVSLAVLNHWKELLAEFGRNGVESAPVVAALSTLSKRSASRYVAQMTRAEREVLLRHLEAELKKGQT